MRALAPWPDFDGNPVQEGDRIVHPSGDSGIVVFRPEAADDDARWQVDYGHGQLRSLSGEVSPAGRATVMDETGKYL